MKEQLIKLYNQRSQYKIDDFIQQVPIEIDIDRLRKEVFSIIVDNNYGTNTVSLKLPIGESNWVDQKEKLETGSVDPFSLLEKYTYSENPIPDENYVNWHPESGPYLKSITSILEETTGLNIGRVRLAWLNSGKGYPIHADTDPMRLHIPIFTNNLSYILHDGKLFNFKYGNVYHLITPSMHTAYNFGKLPRLHLIFSTNGDQEITTTINETSRLSKTNENIKHNLKDSGIDSYSMAQLCKVIGAKPGTKEFGYIKRIHDIIKGI